MAHKVGATLDGNVLSGQEAMASWKSMSSAEKEEWQRKYENWCRSFEACKTPSKAEETLAKRSPVSSEKLVRAPKPEPLPEASPRFQTRAESVKEFEDRWRFLAESLESSSSKHFLKSAQDFHLVYLDVCHLLANGAWKGSAAQAERSLKAWRLNRNKISRVQEWLSELRLGSL